jgi:hypothetical protein
MARTINPLPGLVSDDILFYGYGEHVTGQYINPLIQVFEDIQLSGVEIPQSFKLKGANGKYNEVPLPDCLNLFDTIFVPENDRCLVPEEVDQALYFLVLIEGRIGSAIARTKNPEVKVRLQAFLEFIKSLKDYRPIENY